MKVTRSSAGRAASIFAGASVITALGPHATSVALDFSMFMAKLSMVLFAVMLSIEKDKTE